MKPVNLDDLIPFEINDLIIKELESAIENVYTTEEWHKPESKKITNEKLIDMYDTILRIRELENKSIKNNNNL